MNRPAGFVPANYRLAGRLVLILAGVGLLAAAIDALTAWLRLPNWVLIASLALIPVGLYLLFVPPKEE
ncbi:MAG: hypothetical protein ACK2T0_14030 [Anaerolineales bacterium]|jgi:hypothetical protein